VKACHYIDPIHRMELRAADIGDAKLLYSWVNDSDVRRMSFSPDRIRWCDHERWFKGKLSDGGTRIYIGVCDDGECFGQIRFDILDGGECGIDVHVAKIFMGRGLGTWLISKGVGLFFDEFPDIDKVHGVIKACNVRSINAFRKAGFIDDGKVTVCGEECFRLLKAVAT